MRTDRQRTFPLMPVACGALLFSAIAAADWERPSERFMERLRQISVIYAQDALLTADALAACIEEFLADVSATGLNRCRESWLTSHRSYIRARFFGRVAAYLPGSALEAGSGTELLAIDAWPIQEGYVDSIEAYPTSGIVHDLTVTIDEAGLRKQHRLTAPTEVALGFHPIEFMLWSKTPDDFAPEQNLTPDQRKDGLTVADLPNNRRRTMLALLARMLSREIADQFGMLAREPGRRMASAYSTIAALSRASTEGWRHLRKEVQVYLTGDGEARHSRFSRSTVQDLVSEVETLSSLIDAPGDLISQLRNLDAELAARYAEGVGAAVTLISGLGATDTDIEGRRRLDALIGELIEQSRRFDQHLELAEP